MEIEIPQNLTETSVEELDAIESMLIAAFDELHDAGSTDIAALTEIAEKVEAVRAEKQRRVDAVEQIAALADRVRPTTSEPSAQNDDDEDDDDSDEAEAAAEVLAEVEIEPEMVDEIIEETETAEIEEIEADTQERELVTASADIPARKAPSASAVSRHTTQAETPAPEPSVVITAAADVPGFAAGSSIDTIALARAMHAKARTLSNGSGFVPVATVDLGIEHKLGADMAHNLSVIEEVTKPAALTASGWCAPSTNLYDLFAIDAADGLVDLPTVQVSRGGLNVPGFIGFGDAADGLWTWDEDDNDAAHGEDPEGSKPCLYLPCPTFTDYRLIAEGLCITAGNLTDRAFPELTSRFVQLAVNSHLHRLSGAILTTISTGATGVTMGAVDTSAAGSILNAIDLQVEDYRSQFRMSVNAVLEAIFPLWTKAVIRADLAMRTGVALTNVTDAMVDEHFAARKVRAQFVHDYGALYAASAKTAWPTTMDFLLYAAGSYLRGDGGTIDLGVVRDSTLNATNDYTAAWTEQMYLVAQVGPAAREVTVNFGVDGVTGCCPTAS